MVLLVLRPLQSQSKRFKLIIKYCKVTLHQHTSKGNIIVYFIKVSATQSLTVLGNFIFCLGLNFLMLDFMVFSLPVVSRFPQILLQKQQNYYKMCNLNPPHNPGHKPPVAQLGQRLGLLLSPAPAGGKAGHQVPAHGYTLGCGQSKQDLQRRRTLESNIIHSKGKRENCDF